MPRFSGSLDDDTKLMLRDLVDLKAAREGKGTEAGVLIDKIRKAHREEFPNEYNRGVWTRSSYALTA